MRTPDELTAVLVLARPAPYLISAFAASETPIVPKHVYAGSRADATPANNAPIVAHADPAASMQNHDSDAHAWRGRVGRDAPSRRAIGGNIEVVGTPEQVTEQFARLSQAGIDGLQLSFFDFQPDRDFFGRRTLPLLAWLAVSAVTDEDTPRLGSFVVPGDAPGVSIIEAWDTIGMRATGSHDVALDGVTVAAGHAIELRPAAEGTRPDPFGSVWFMGLTGAVYDGVARAARDEAVSFACRFAPAALGAPLSSVPHIQQAVGAMEVLLDTNDRLLDSLAADVSASRLASTTAPLVRLVVIENAIRAVDLALEIAGNHGLVIGGALERLHRDVICGRTHPPGAALVRQAAAARILAEA